MNGGELKTYVTLNGKHRGKKLHGDLLILKWIQEKQGESGRMPRVGLGLDKKFLWAPSEGGQGKYLYTNWKGSL
jgi:hypothetical protein